MERVHLSSGRGVIDDDDGAFVCGVVDWLEIPVLYEEMRGRAKAWVTTFSIYVRLSRCGLEGHT